MTAAAWQAAILAGLEERDARERAFDPIIEQCKSCINLAEVDSPRLVLRFVHVVVLSSRRTVPKRVIFQRHADAQSISADRRLAQQTLTLKERNRSLLKAATSVVPTSQGGSGVASE